MTDTAKHGVLLFDAVHLRKSLHVNSSTLTYSGLEDFGNDILELVIKKTQIML